MLDYQVIIFDGDIMKTRTKLTATALSIVLSSISLTAPGHTQQASGPPPCTADPAFRAFDFWIGDWEVTPWAGGAVAGHNKIAAVEGGCALSENWTNINGGTGRSLNYYNPNTGKWRQLWVAGGYSIDIVGGLSNGAMALEGDIYYYGQKNTVPFKGTWTPQDDGSVRQHFEQFNPETKEWATWFDGRYVKTSAE